MQLVDANYTLSQMSLKVIRYNGHDNHVYNDYWHTKERFDMTLYHSAVTTA